MPLRDTSRSVDDILYSLGTSLQRFKGENGLKRMLDAGKLSWLSFLGEFQESRDELFARRTCSLNSTRKCLLTINDLFEDVTRYATKLTDKVDQINKALDKFHRCCDIELENPETSTDDDFALAEDKLREIGKMTAGIKTALGEFCDSASTCKTLNVSTVSQLQEVDNETAGSVGKAQTDFDTQRRRVQVKAEEVNQLRASGMQPGQGQLELAEFNRQCENEAMQAASDTYFIALREAMTSTSFALEQTCMATWASSNVFFVQFGIFLKELNSRVNATAKLLIDVKNSQSVSKQIGVERKAMLDALHPKDTVAPLSVPSDFRGARDGAHASDLDDLFGAPVTEPNSVHNRQPLEEAPVLSEDAGAARMSSIDKPLSGEWRQQESNVYAAPPLFRGSLQGSSAQPGQVQGTPVQAFHYTANPANSNPANPQPMPQSQWGSPSASDQQVYQASTSATASYQPPPQQQQQQRQHATIYQHSGATWGQPSAGSAGVPVSYQQQQHQQYGQQRQVQLPGNNANAAPPFASFPQPPEPQQHPSASFDDLFQ